MKLTHVLEMHHTSLNVEEMSPSAHPSTARLELSTAAPRPKHRLRLPWLMVANQLSCSLRVRSVNAWMDSPSLSLSSSSSSNASTLLPPWFGPLWLWAAVPHRRLAVGFGWWVLGRLLCCVCVQPANEEYVAQFISCLQTAQPLFQKKVAAFALSGFLLRSRPPIQFACVCCVSLEGQ